MSLIIEIELFVKSVVSAGFFFPGADEFFLEALHAHRASALFLLISCVAGNLTGYLLWFYVGAQFVRSVMTQLLPEALFDSVEERFQHYESYLIFVGCFIGFLVKPICILAGMFDTSIRKMVSLLGIILLSKYVLLALFSKLFTTLSYQVLLSYMEVFTFFLALMCWFIGFTINAVRLRLNDREVEL